MPLLQTTVAEAPYEPPIPVGDDGIAWGGLRNSWTGWDGSTWPLTRESGVYLLASGVRGHAMPPVQRYTSQAPMLAGSRWRGSRTEERDVFWPLCVWHDQSSQAWIERDRAFWRTMHPDRPGVWTVHQPNGESRSLVCRYADDESHAYTVSPAAFGWAMYGVRLIAEQPYWQGEPIVREWRASDPVPFFGPPGVINISSGATLGSATITNPGDVTGHVIWTVYGPFTSAQLGVQGKLIEIPFSVPDGRALRVDTRPDRLLATSHNVVDGALRDDVVRDLTDSLGDAQWTGIPAGADVPLSLAVAGTGAIRAELPPLFYRAW